MALVYSLKEDPDAISWLRDTDHLVAKAGREQPPVGTPEWLEAMEDGRIATDTLECVITRVFEERQGDWPRFELSSDGRVTTWTREGDPAAYRVGQVARIWYLKQSFVKRAFGVTERLVTLEISLSDE
jgi:hypothetical protein